VYVDDLIQGLLVAAEHPHADGQTYFITYPTPISYFNMNQAITEAMQKRAVPIRVPLFVIYGGIYLMDLMSMITGKSYVVNRYKIPEIINRYWICDGSKARKDLGFQPQIGFKEAITRCADWYQKIGWL
jgi:nucleoside-diphosphate-sugar epimerase